MVIDISFCHDLHHDLLRYTAKFFHRVKEYDYKDYRSFQKKGIGVALNAARCTRYRKVGIFKNVR